MWKHRHIFRAFISDSLHPIFYLSYPFDLIIGKISTSPPPSGPVGVSDQTIATVSRQGVGSVSSSRSAVCDMRVGSAYRNLC